MRSIGSRRSLSTLRPTGYDSGNPNINKEGYSFSDNGGAVSLSTDSANTLSTMRRCFFFLSSTWLSYVSCRSTINRNAPPCGHEMLSRDGKKRSRT